MAEKLLAAPLDGIIEQLNDYREHVDHLFGDLIDTIERHRHREHRALIEELRGRTAVLEQLVAQLTSDSSPPGQPAVSFDPWYSPERFEESFRGSAALLAERYAELADRLVGLDPVVDIGCGRGEFVELLLDRGVTATGVDLDGRIVAAGVERGLPLEAGDGLAWLGDREEASVGGVVALQVVEHLSAQQLLDFVSSTARVLRPGGVVMAETPNPQSLIVFAAALYVDPTHTTPIHPEYLAFLFREAGFSDVRIELRSPVPSDQQLPPVDGEDERLADGVNEIVRRLNGLIYGHQDYAIIATQ